MDYKLSGTVYAWLIENEINTVHQIEIKKQDTYVYRLALICMSVACLFALSTNESTAADSTVPDDAYVDSVYSWGIWELGLEPASGPKLSENNAMNDRSRKLLFRPNDNTAYAAQSVPVPPVSSINPLPPKPALPPKPVPPVPAGPPGFTGGTPTSTDPRVR